MNPETLSLKQQLFTYNVSLLIQYICVKKYACTFAETYRTPEQAELNAKKGTGIKDSLHCKRLAVDLNLFSPEGKYLTDVKDYPLFGEYWETLHPKNRWGGRFKNLDANHFEMQE